MAEDAGAGAIDDQRAALGRIARLTRQRFCNAIAVDGIGLQRLRARSTGQCEGGQREPRAGN
jgi:hypothetical protein